MSRVWRSAAAGVATTAVAGVPTTAVEDVAPTEVEDVATPEVDDDDESFIDSRSVVGDTASEAECDGRDARRQQPRAPKEPTQGDPSQRRSAQRNSEFEVGNFGIFFGNWGLRGTLGGKVVSRARTAVADAQVLRCPAQLVIVAEASEQLEELLKEPPVEGDLDATGVRGRNTFEHFAVRGNEEAALLVAARKDNVLGLTCLKYEAHGDHEYKEKGTTKMARSRMMVCQVTFKQNIGHVGKDFNVCAVHGHYRTMKMEWPAVWKQFWDRLASYVRVYDVKFLAGDFNMSLTEVPKQLRSRGIHCDCAAWYPWEHAEIKNTAVADKVSMGLGFDSCGIFYIGGVVEVVTTWNLDHLHLLTAVADQETGLDVYEGNAYPGQPWKCYRSRKERETDADKNVKERLTDLLTPSTTEDQLQRIPRRDGVYYCPYLRLKQKALQQNEWLVNGGIHNGAHFPLCVFTNNSRARSEEGVQKRKEKHRSRGGSGKGKGRGRNTAVAEPRTKGKDGGKGFREEPSSSSGQRERTRFDYGGNAVHNPKWSDEDSE